MIDGRQTGPFKLEELPQAGLTPESYVWCKGMEDWKQAREVGEICRYYRNRLYDLAHPAPAPAPDEINAAAAQENDGDMEKYADVPIRFRNQISKADPADVDFDSFSAEPDMSRKPTTWWPWPMILSLLFFLPLGILAISQARKADKAWKAGKAGEAYEYARRGKMAAGMSFSFGLIVIAAFIPMLF